MRYKSCQWVNRCIEFRTDSLRLCCYAYLQGRETEHQTIIKENYHGEFLSPAEIFAIKQKYKNMHKNGEYLDACKDCIYLQEKDWDDDDYINHFTFNHWTKCNCSCSYCYTRDERFFTSAGEGKAIDTVGAGDSLSAAFIYFLSQGKGMNTSLINASLLADYVVQHRGAIPEYDDDIRRKLSI